MNGKKIREQSNEKNLWLMMMVVVVLKKKMFGTTKKSHEYTNNKSSSVWINDCENGYFYIIDWNVNNNDDENNDIAL